MQKVVIVPTDDEGNVIEGDYKDGIIGKASTLDDAKNLAVSKGYALVDFDTPDHIPGSLIGDDTDAFAVGVY